MQKLDNILSIGSRCNNSCALCRFMGSKGQDKSIEQLKEELSCLDPKKPLIISGGEPSIHPDFISAIGIAKARYDEILLETNARAFCYADFCKKSIGAGITGFHVLLFSHLQEIHDRHTGINGSFSQAVHGIKNIIASGAGVMARIVITKDSYKQLPALLKLLSALKVKAVQYVYPESPPEQFTELEKQVPCIIEAHSYLMDADRRAKELGITRFPMSTPFNTRLRKSAMINSKISSSDARLVYDTDPVSDAVPLASVIIPTYDRSEKLELTLLSLYNQTFHNFEVIVVDDGSADDTPNMIRSLSPPYRLRYYVQDKIAYGPGRARNNGARNAKSPLLVFIDADVLSDPDNIRQHIIAHESDPGSVIIGLRFDLCKSAASDKALNPQTVMNSFDMIKRLPMELDMREDFFYWSDDKPYSFKAPWTMFYTNNVSVQKKEYLAVGGIDESFLHWSVEDQELAYRLQHRGQKVVLHRGCIGYHQHHPIVYANHNGMIKAIKYNARIFYKKFIDPMVYDMFYDFLSYSKEEVVLESQDDEPDYWAALSKKHQQQKPTEDEINKQLEFARGEGQKSLAIIAGSCVCFDRIISLARLASSFGFSDISLATSGSFLGDKDKIASIAQSGIIKVAIPIAGHEQSLHDMAVRKPGSFDLRISSIPLLKKHGVRVEARLIVTKKNYFHLKKMVGFLASKDVRDIIFHLPFCFEEDGVIFNESSIPLCSNLHYSLMQGLKEAIRNGMRIRTENIFTEQTALFSILVRRMYDLFKKDISVSRGMLR